VSIKEEIHTYGRNEEILRAILTDTNEKHIAKFLRGSRDNH